MLSFIERVKDTIGGLTASAKNESAARDEKAESDIEADSHVAGSRAGSAGDGEFVGRTSPAIDADVGETGAEARSEQRRRSQ